MTRKDWLDRRWDRSVPTIRTDAEEGPGGTNPMKKLIKIATAVALVSTLALTGCKKKEKEGAGGTTGTPATGTAPKAGEGTAPAGGEPAGGTAAAPAGGT